MSDKIEKKTEDVGPHMPLEDVCWALLDDVNERHPDKERLEWECPYFQTIATIIGYE